MFTRTMTYRISRTRQKDLFSVLKDMSFASKNLYNKTLYVLRQLHTKHFENIKEFENYFSDVTHGDNTYKVLSDYSIIKCFQQNNVPEYRALKAQVAQQIIIQAYTAYMSFKKLSNEYFKNKNKFNKRPRFPDYKPKDGYNLLTYTNQCFSITKDNKLKLSKDLILDNIKLNFDYNKLRQVRIIPKFDYFQIEIVYDKPETDFVLNSNTQDKFITASIDVGVNTICAITSDNMDVLPPSLINGRQIKHINNYYNKQLAKIKHKYAKLGIKHTTTRIKRLINIRNSKIKDIMSKIANYLTCLFVKSQVKSVVVGHNIGWKQNIKMGKKNNQTFIQIPYNILFKKLEYKLGEVGIDFQLRNEAYTSKCSFYDNEVIGKNESYLGKRLGSEHGRCYITKEGKTLNGDINGSGNILRLHLNKNIAFNNSIFNPKKITVKDIDYTSMPLSNLLLNRKEENASCDVLGNMNQQCKRVSAVSISSLSLNKTNDIIVKDF